jgi:hypothetical protein
MQYLRVFALLWRLKRVESALSSSWMVLQCEVERALSKFPQNQSENCRYCTMSCVAAFFLHNDCGRKRKNCRLLQNGF